MTIVFTFLITEYIFDSDYLFVTLGQKLPVGLPEKLSIVLAITLIRLVTLPDVGGKERGWMVIYD